jgi:hypothetical protein
VSDNLALIIAERDKWIAESERLRADLTVERQRREAAEAAAQEALAANAVCTINEAQWREWGQQAIVRAETTQSSMSAALRDAAQLRQRVIAAEAALAAVPVGAIRELLGYIDWVSPAIARQKNATAVRQWLEQQEVQP